MKAEHFILILLVFVYLLLNARPIFEDSQYHNKYKNSKEIITIAKVISAEACSEGSLGMAGVASTIKNRISKSGLSAYEVVTKPNQYYGLTNKNRDKIFSDSRCSIPALFYARNINTIPDIVKGALFFKTPDEKIQKWHKEKTVTLGKLEFYK